MLILRSAPYVAALFVIAGFGMLSAFTIYRFGPTSAFGEKVCKAANDLIDKIGGRIMRLETAYATQPAIPSRPSIRLP